MTFTLRARLAVISTLVFGALLATLSAVSYRVLQRQLDADVSARLTELTDGLHGYLRFENDTPSVAFDTTDADQAAFIHEATQYYQLYDSETGRLVVQSRGLEPLGLRFAPAEVRTFREQQRPVELTTDYGRVRLSNSVVSGAHGRSYLLQVGISLAPMDTALRRYRDLLLWGVPSTLLVAVVAAWSLSGFALVPLSRFAAATRGIGVESLDRRLPLRGVDDELDAVGRAFNDTLARLERSIGEMRQFSAALAHELRTPLAALRGEIELSLRRQGTGDEQRRAFANQLEELDRLSRLIDHILTLARAEAGQIHLAFAPLNVADLAASLVEQLEPLAEARDIELRCEGTESVVIEGDAGWLQRLLLNLLDNALKFTSPGGRVAVRVSRDGGNARIDVTDTGIGMSSEDAQQVFEPFFRADPARSSVTEGAGLGLSLVRWIVERHHGTILVSSRPGEGSTFTVTLPLLPSRASDDHESVTAQVGRRDWQ